MSHTKTLSEVQPKAVMTDAEIAAWDALPATVQLERMRAAIDKGVTGPRSKRTVQDILDSVLASRPDVRL